jgi:transposase-like protein
MGYTGSITSAHRTVQLRGYGQLTEDEKARVVECRVEHELTMKQIRHRFGISDDTTRQILKENNVERRTNYDG